MTRVGPESPLTRALSASTTIAVITFATLAAGAGDASPEVAMRPSPEAPTAAEPTPGHGRLGGVPGIVDWTGLEVVAATSGIGLR